MKRAIICIEQEEPKGHPQFYDFSMGHEPGEFWIHGSVRARSPAKAFKKARRVQLKTGWPYMSCRDNPQRRQDWPTMAREAGMEP